MGVYFGTGQLGWPPQLWAGVVLLTGLLGVVLLQPHVVRVSIDVPVPHP